MTIYYIAPDLNRPSGGVRTIYRHVERLTALGYDAAVLHGRSGFRCDWFENSTRIVYAPLTVTTDDVIVVPEQHTSEQINTLAPGVRKVIFNQSAYRTFIPRSVHENRVADKLNEGHDVDDMMVVSEDSRDYMEYAFPGLSVARIHHSINPDLFHADLAKRRKQIALIPRKRPVELRQVMGMLTNRGVLEGWTVAELTGKTETEVALTLQESVLFISLNRAEGFGLPPLEAMACGCQVIGFHGMGGREYFRVPFAEAIEDGDVVSLARAIERFVVNYDSRADEHARVAQEASSFALGTYAKEQESADLDALFKDVLTRLPSTRREVVIHGHDLRVEPRLRTGLRRRMVPLGRRLLGIDI